MQELEKTIADLRVREREISDLRNQVSVMAKVINDYQATIEAMQRSRYGREEVNSSEVIESFASDEESNEEHASV